MRIAFAPVRAAVLCLLPAGGSIAVPQELPTPQEAFGQIPLSARMPLHNVQIKLIKRRGSALIAIPNERGILFWSSGSLEEVDPNSGAKVWQSPAPSRLSLESLSTIIGLSYKDIAVLGLRHDPPKGQRTAKFDFYAVNGATGALSWSTSLMLREPTLREMGPDVFAFEDGLKIALETGQVTREPAPDWLRSVSAVYGPPLGRRPGILVPPWHGVGLAPNWDGFLAFFFPGFLESGSEEMPSGIAYLIKQGTRYKDAWRGKFIVYPNQDLKNNVEVGYALPTSAGLLVSIDRGKDEPSWHWMGPSGIGGDAFPPSLHVRLPVLTDHGLFFQANGWLWTLHGRLPARVRRMAYTGYLDTTPFGYLGIAKGDLLKDVCHLTIYPYFGGEERSQRKQVLRSGQPAPRSIPALSSYHGRVNVLSSSDHTLAEPYN